MKIFRVTLILALLLFQACAGGGKEGGSDPSPTYTIQLAFERIETGSLNPFRVTASVFEDGQAKGSIGSGLNIDLGRGTRNALTEIATGQYQFTVTPDQTGEYPVTVSYKDASITRTALVLASVHEDWGQPLSVPGLVNTTGYEDGITISPDGEYLFVQYGPLYFSGIYLFNLPRANGGCGGLRLDPDRCTHPWIDDVIGPYTAPERPGFFDGRIAETMDGPINRHNANSWGLGDDEAIIFAPSTMFYGFKRQADGSFAEPFYLSFDDENDAIINPFGMSFIMNGDGSATMLFAMDDPSNPDMVDLDGDGTDDAESLADIYTTTVTFGQNNVLGTFNYTGTPGTPPERGTPFPSQLVNFGKTGIDGIAGTQGNPHLYEESGVIRSIWTDDEQDARGPGSDRGDLSVYVLDSGTLTNGAWTKVILPSPVNQASPSDEIQPFFTGNGLYYTHMSDTDLPEVYYASYSGTHSITDFQTSNNWGIPEKILGLGPADAIGKVTAIGEPTIANFNGGEYLYFVYGIIRGYDSTSGLADIDMQAGFIKKK
jgi:hypothetical protein